jgi:hypothetical protein
MKKPRKVRLRGFFVFGTGYSVLGARHLHLDKKMFNSLMYLVDNRFPLIFGID